MRDGAHRVRVPWGGEGDLIDDDTRRALSCVLWRNWQSRRDDEDCRVTACGRRAPEMRSRGVGTQRHVSTRGTCRHSPHTQPDRCGPAAESAFS